MRAKLSELLTAEAIKDPKFVILSGDHGYALFDELRKARPDQFVNCGVAEQAMIGIAAGMAKEGYRVVVYGLAAFVPMRCLEQIKLDLCLAKLPVIIIGDGAGLVYSHLGPSHMCAEDLAALMPMPNLEIYSPADANELEQAFYLAKGPTYIRIGKADRKPLKWRRIRTATPLETAILAHGAMASIAEDIAYRLHLSFMSVPKLKPLQQIPFNGRVIVIEEHSRYGGLYSLVSQMYFNAQAICLKDQFSEKCGDYQYALSEHDMNDEQLYERVKAIVQG